MLKVNVAIKKLSTDDEMLNDAAKPNHTTNGNDKVSFESHRKLSSMPLGVHTYQIKTKDVLNHARDN